MSVKLDMIFKRRRKNKRASEIRKRTYVDNPRYYTQLYATPKKELKVSAVEERKKRTRQKKYKRKVVFSSARDFVKRLFSRQFLLPFFIILLFAVPYVSLRNFDLFVVDSIEVYGNEIVQEEDVLAVVSSYQGSNLFSFSVGSIEEQLELSSVFTKQAYVRKKLPDTLEIEIVERVPQLVLITFEGVFLFDDEYRVIFIFSEDSLQLLPFERSILANNADFEDEYVQERYLLAKEDDAEEEFDWEEVPAEEKQKIVEEISQEVSSQVNEYIFNAKESIPEEYQELSQVIFYEQQSFPLNLDIDSPKLLFSSNLISAIQEDFRVESINWISEYSAEVLLPENKRLIVSRNRELDEQLDDFYLLIEEGAFEQGSVIDVRVPTLLVE